MYGRLSYDKNKNILRPSPPMPFPAAPRVNVPSHLGAITAPPPPGKKPREKPRQGVEVV